MKTFPLFLALALTGCVDRTDQKALTQAKARIADLETELSRDDTTMAVDAAKLEAAENALQTNAAQLAAEKAELDQYRGRFAEFQAQVDDFERRQKLVEAVPVSNTFIFPLVLSPTGQPLMTNGEYVRVIGRGVRFKCDTDLEVFDVDDLHPSILARLGIDGEQAKKNESEIREAKARFFAAIGSAAAKTQTQQAEWQQKWNQEQAAIVAAQQAKAVADEQKWLSMPRLNLPVNKYQRIGFGMGR